jgi:hypothetical protein
MAEANHQPQNEESNQGEQQPQQGGFNIRNLFYSFLRVYIAYVLVSTVLGGLFGKSTSNQPGGEQLPVESTSLQNSNSQSQIKPQTTSPPTEDYNPITAFFNAQSYKGESSHYLPTFEVPQTTSPLRNLWREGSQLQFECWLSPEKDLSYDDLLSTTHLSDSTLPSPQLTRKVLHKTVFYEWDDSVKFFGNENYLHSDTINLLSISPLYESHLFHNNQTLYAHIYLYQTGSSPSVFHPRYNLANVIYLTEQITRFVWVPKSKQLKKLLTSAPTVKKASTSIETNIIDPSSTELVPVTNQLLNPVGNTAEPTGVTISYLIPTLTVRMVVDSSVYPSGGIPAPLTQFFNVFPKQRGYRPVGYIDRFWEMRSDYVRLFPKKGMGESFSTKDDVNQNGEEIGIDQGNDNELQIDNGSPLKVLNYTISYAPTSIIRWQMQRQIDLQWKQQENMGLSTRSQNDTTKRLILETNPYLLVLTLCVSLLHSVFEFLAFKNDISHWKSLEHGKGMSIRTLFYNAISQTIIFLYLLDNDTSYVILMSTGFNVLLEIWKITKARDVTVKPQWPFVIISTKESFKSDPKEDKGDKAKSGKNDNDTQNEAKDDAQSAKKRAEIGEKQACEDEEDRTDEYDAMAYHYLSYIMIPLGIGYTAYSLVYNQYSSWYSFIISTSVSYIYMFGFIPMTAQLFINYRLKSTAHIPAKVWMYKCLNTFIDDLFSFVIKMPWLHRLACLRDDFVFLILLYQKWIYRVDYTRINEYGQAFDQDGEQRNVNEDLKNKKKKVNDEKKVQFQDVSAVKSIPHRTDINDEGSDVDYSDSGNEIPNEDGSVLTQLVKFIKIEGNKIDANKTSTINANSTNSVHQLPVTLATSALSNSLNINNRSTTLVNPSEALNKAGNGNNYIPGLHPTANPSMMDIDSTPLSGKGKYGDDGMYPDEEIPDWVLQNQKKLLEMKNKEISMMENNQVYREFRLQQQQLAEFEVKKKYGLIDENGNEIEPK